jgi:hypothetical protein
MDLIEKEAVLAPLQVLSILALNPRLPLHVAANYMSSTLKVCVCLLFISGSVFALCCLESGGLLQRSARFAVVTVVP